MTTPSVSVRIGRGRRVHASKRRPGLGWPTTCGLWGWPAAEDGGLLAGDARQVEEPVDCRSCLRALAREL